MATTTNYGWTTPDDTALVKDGASAIRSLGSAIDSTVYSKLGLVHINTTSFSAVSSQSISDVFSTTYDNYKILISGIGSTGNTISFRMRVSGTDDSSSTYNAQNMGAADTSVGGGRFSNNATSAYLAHFDTAYNSYSYDFFAPFLARATTFVGGGADDGMATNASTSRFIIGGHNTATSYTGLSLLVNTGTITGSISIYGYKK